MTQEQLSEHILAEIEHLKQKVEARRREGGMTEGKSERELFDEAFRERFQELTESIRAASPSPSVAPSAPAGALPVDDVKREKEIERLLYIAFQKHPREAIAEAERSGGDYLLDILHDRLRDEYYEKLIQFKKIEQL